MIVDQYGRTIDAQISPSDLASKLLNEVKNVTTIQTEEVKNQTALLDEIKNLVKQINENIDEEAEKTRKIVEKCCQASNRNSPNKLDPSEADEGRENIRTIMDKTSNLMENMQRSITDGFDNLYGKLTDISNVLLNCCPDSKPSIREPATVVQKMNTPEGGVSAVTRSPKTKASMSTTDIIRSVFVDSPSPPPMRGDGGRYAYGGGIEGLSDDFEKMSAGFFAIQASLMRLSNHANGFLKDIGIDLSTITRGLVADTLVYTTNIRMASFETRGLGEDTENLARQWINIGNVSSQTGFDRAKFQTILQNEARRGLTLERRLVEKNGKIQTVLVKRQIKDQVRLNKNSVQTAFMLGSNADQTAEMFSEWQRTLSLSNLELFQMSDSLKTISRVTGVSGDNLLNAAKSVTNITKEMRKTGALTVSAMANITQMSALFQKYGLEDFGGSLTTALSSWKNFNQASPQLRALIAQAANATGLMDKVYAGTALANRTTANKLFKGIEGQLMNYLGRFGINDLKELPSLLQKLDLGMAGARYGDKTDQTVLAGQIRNFLDRKGIGPGEIDAFIKVAEENKPPLEKLAELEKKRDDFAKKRLPIEGITRAIEELKQSMLKEQFSTFASNLEKTATREEALQQTNEMLRLDGLGPMTMDQVNKSVLSSIQELRTKASDQGIEKKLFSTLKNEGFSSFEQLSKQMMSRDNVESSNAMETFNLLQQQLEVDAKVSTDPSMQIRQAILEGNDYLKQIAESWLIRLSGPILVGVISAALIAKGTSAIFSLLGVLNRLVGVFGKSAAGGFGSAVGGGAASAAGSATTTAATTAAGSGILGWLARMGGKVVPGAIDAQNAVTAAQQAGVVSKWGLAGRAARGFGSIGRKIPGIGMLLDAGMRIWDSSSSEMDSTLSRDDKNRKHLSNATGFAGGIGGGLAGAKLGGMGGAAIGTMIFPGVGTAIGAAIGAFGGGIAGYFGGSKLGEWIGKNLYEPLKESFSGVWSIIKTLAGAVGSVVGWIAKAAFAASSFVSPISTLVKSFGWMGVTISPITEKLGGLINLIGKFAGVIIAATSPLSALSNSVHMLEKSLKNSSDIILSVFSAGIDGLIRSVKSAFEGVSEWIKSFFGWGNKEKSESLDQKVQGVQKEQMKSGTYYAHDDARNPLRDYWKSVRSNEERIQTGIQVLDTQTVKNDPNNFNANAKMVLQQALVQEKRYNSGGTDQWSETIRSVENAASKLGIALDSETQRSLDLLKGKSQKEFMQTQVRNDLQKQGFIIGDNISKKEFDVKTADLLAKRLESAGLNSDGTEKMESMAEKAIKPGSIYTHDIHSEKILGQILAVISGGFDNKEIVGSLSEENVVAMPELMGAFSYDQPKEAMIDAINNVMAMTQMQGGILDQPESQKLNPEVVESVYRILENNQNSDESSISSTSDILKKIYENNDRLPIEINPQSMGLFARDQSRMAMMDANDSAAMKLTLGKDFLIPPDESKTISEIIRTISEDYNRQILARSASSSNLGLFEAGLGREAITTANQVNSDQMSLNTFSSERDLELNRVRFAIEQQKLEESARNMTSVLNAGLFDPDNVKETNRESLSMMSSIYGRDLNLAYTSAQASKLSRSGKGNVATSNSMYLTEDDDYPTLNTYLSNAAMINSIPTKGQVSSNLISMEEAEQYVSRAVEGDKPNGPSVLIPGLDAIVDYLSNEAAEREERMIKILEQIRDQKIRPNLISDQNGASAKDYKKSGIRNWSRDVVKGFWTEAMHGTFAEQTNHTGDVRGGS